MTDKSLVELEDEVLLSTLETVFHALKLAFEARNTPDDEDAEGNPLEPIHNYAAIRVKEAVPLAVLGLFALHARAALNEGTDQGSED